MEDLVENSGEQKEQHGRYGVRWYVVVGGVVTAVILLGIGFWVGKRRYSPQVSDIVQVPWVSPMPTSVPADPTANWKVFYNLGISFKYPQYLTEQPYQTYGGGKVPEQHFTDSETKDDLWFRVEDNINLVNNKPYVNIQDVCAPCNGKNISLDGQPVLSMGNIIFFFSPDKKKKYDFQFDGPSLDKNLEVFNQILSTFKFLN